MEKIFLVYYSHKHGVDITAYRSMERALQIAEDIRAEWWPSAKTYLDIVEFSDGHESIEILESDLEDKVKYE